MRIPGRSGLLLAILAVTLVSTMACVFPGWNRSKQARADYEACLDEHPEDPEACDEARENARREYDRYEDDAQRQWGDRERSWSP